MDKVRKDFAVTTEYFCEKCEVELTEPYSLYTTGHTLCGVCIVEFIKENTVGNVVVLPPPLYQIKGEKKMTETREKVKCKRCDNGWAWLTREQVESGTTTKRGEWVKCPCCKGNHRDCMQCYIDEVFGENE